MAFHLDNRGASLCAIETTLIGSQIDGAAIAVNGLENIVPADAQATTPALFLAGKGNIVQDFTASYADGAAPGTVVLKLVPKRGDPEFEYLLVTVDPVSIQMRGLGARDLQGGDSTLSFMNLKENQGISDTEFAFRIPRGVDVVDYVFAYPHKPVPSRGSA